MSLAHGRRLRAIPGPSVVPDRVLRAMHRAAPNIYAGELIELTDSVVADLNRLAGTEGDAVIYIGNGHAGWEAATANILAPGDRALAIATGRFGLGWAEMARRMGVEVEVMDFGFRAALDPERVAVRLREDAGRAIKAVLTVQTDTASAVRNDIPALRAAMDAAGHPALLAVDCIACLACDPFRMDKWGVDVTVAASQKGLMTPPGLAFVWANARAQAAQVELRSPYWDWEPRIRPSANYQRFCGTPPTHHLYGLREALDMILIDEGLDGVWSRHATFASAVWAAVEAWGAGGALALNIAAQADRSTAVTTIRTGPGEGDRLRAWCETEAGLTLGIGLSGAEEDDTSLFRIGHMGHLDPPMLLGALATIEAGLAACAIPHATGGAAAAARVVAAAAPATA